uniref:Glutaredoxin n=1 Tax=Antirrhinum australe TaxID=237480 RepID=A0A6H2RXI9_9LAMI
MQYDAEPPEIVRRKVGENPVVIFTVSTCYLCLTVKSLFRGLGVNTTVFELDEEPDGKELEKALLGSVDRVLASHIGGMLVPLLKEAGALWL